MTKETSFTMYHELKRLKGEDEGYMQFIDKMCTGLSKDRRLLESFLKRQIQTVMLEIRNEQ